MPPPQDETTEQHGPSSPGRWVSAPHPAHRVWAGSSLITGAAAGLKTQSRPQPLHARFHEQWGTIPSQSSTWPRHLPTEAGRARGGGGTGRQKTELFSRTNPDTVTAQAWPVHRNVAQISVWAFGPKNLQEGLSWMSPSHAVLTASPVVSCVTTRWQ